MKTGFAAYDEINDLAHEVYGPNTEVAGMITGDWYEVSINFQKIMEGTSGEIRQKLQAVMDQHKDCKTLG